MNVLDDPEWYCEECGQGQFGEPAYKESHKGYEGYIELWFCDECTVRDPSP